MSSSDDVIMPVWETVAVEITDGIAWITLNRPDKRNAMNPAMNREMIEVLDLLEMTEACRCVVLTGAGRSFSAGMDIKEYFRETDGLPKIMRERAFRAAADWQWRRLRSYAKPTIAMVDGWCFGGGFVPMIACDLAIAADDATFGLSEINWGIIPAGNVAKALDSVIGSRAALYYIMTGETFDGTKAERLGLVNEAVPAEKLRSRTAELAAVLMQKNPTVLRQAKVSFKNMPSMDWELSDEYLRAKQDQSRILDDQDARARGMKGFLDDKSFKPGLSGNGDEAPR
jgi:trans-feruloyl-CoA hydratase/vanillin synthase